jgi:hypothetical protein
MLGKFYRDASDRLTFGVFEVNAEVYSDLCGRIAETFQLDPLGPAINGLDVVFRDFARDNQIVGLEWDIWSGFTVVAENLGSEELVRQVASYLCATIGWARINTDTQEFN